MNILDIIAKKRDKNELTKEEIEYFILHRKAFHKSAARALEKNPKHGRC